MEIFEVRDKHPLKIIKKTMKHVEITKSKLICGSVCLSILLLISIILISLSFSYVEWDEYGLKRNTASNHVDYTQVFSNGRYFWGLAYQPVTFKNTVSSVSFNGDNSLVIFTEGGLELKIDCSFQYAVIKEELPTLYKNYGTTYPQQIVSISRSILKNIASNYTTEEYYQKRDLISQAMYGALRSNLRQEMNVNVTLFQLDYVQLPDLLLKKLLSIAIQDQNNIKEQYLQQSTIIRQETLALAAQIIANATVINQTAQATAAYIVNSSQARAFSIIQEAKKSGLDRLYQGLGLNSSGLKLSYLYTTQITAETGYNVDLLVNVNSVIIPQS